MQCNETAMYMYAWVCASIGKSLCTVPRGKAALRAQGRWGLPAEETTHPPPGHTCQNPARPPTHPDRKINLWGGKSPSPAKEQNPVVPPDAVVQGWLAAMGLGPHMVDSRCVRTRALV